MRVVAEAGHEDDRQIVLGRSRAGEDVVSGLCATWQKGNPGVNYILGGPDASLNGLWSTFQVVAGRKILRLPLPGTLFRLSAYAEDWMSTALGSPPLVTPTTSAFFLNDWTFSSNRASSQLEYTPRSLEEGLRNTCQWMRREGLL